MQAMTAFAHTSLSDEAWWAGISPHLTVEAQEVWRYTSPSKIPPLDPLIVESGTQVIRTTAEVRIATAAGVYQLTLYRGSGADPYLVSAITAPQDVP